ncbi:hypothetical protein D3C74_400580 [compost metagenome]
MHCQVSRSRARRQIHLTVRNQLAVLDTVKQHLIDAQIADQHTPAGTVRNNRMGMRRFLPVLTDS